MIARLLGRYWPFLIIAALVAFGLYQRDRANDAETLAASRAQTITSQENALQGFGEAIASQNQSIEALAERRTKGRTIYLQDYARADQRATAKDDRAAQLLGLQSQFADELAECRAARTLLEQEMSQ